MKALRIHLKKLNPVKTSDAFHVILRSQIRRELGRQTFGQKIGYYFKTYKVPAFVTGLAAVILISYLSYNTFLKSENLSEFSSYSASGEQADNPLNVRPTGRGKIQNLKNTYYVIEQYPIEDFLKTGDEISSEFSGEMWESGPAPFDSIPNPQSIPVQIYPVAKSVTF